MKKADLKKELLTAYVLHLMIWGELAKTGGAEKQYTAARSYHFAKPCELCKMANIINSQTKQCTFCPAVIGRQGLKSYTHYTPCLSGLYNKWREAKSIKKRKQYAAQIRDVELVPEIKKLIME